MLVYSENKLRYIWNAAVMISSGFLAFYIPLNLQFNLDHVSVFHLIYWLVLIIYFADLIVNFVRFRNGKKAGSLTSTWSSYFIRWFWIDLIAALPLTLFFGSGLFQILPLIKLVRVIAYMGQLHGSEIRFSFSLTLTFFLYWTAILVHWLSCGWIFISGIDPTFDSATNYIRSLYWIVTTLTSVGYGDIVPITNTQRLYAILIQVSGIGVFGYLVGNVVSLLSKKDLVNTRYVENVELLTTALKRRDLSKDLQKRILDYYAYCRDEKMGYDESGFLQSLPDSLKTEVALNLKKEFIEGIPLFKNASDKFIIEIALNLELTVATPGGYIFKADDPGSEMFFIISGEMSVLNKEEDQVLTTLKEGDFFGEIALFKNQPRSATVKAISYCNLYTLKRETFKEVISKHPEVAVQLEYMSKSRE